ncbi:MAG: phosphodiester glycosidase family protein [Clostridia bacterium]|nr:phosphodiester glycosidase family protein [Clostridia bacterium]
MRRALALLLLLLALTPLPAPGEEACPPRTYESFDHRAYFAYESDSLKYKIETFNIHGIRCFLTKVWVQDPEHQIRKATSTWGKDIQLPKKMAMTVPGAALAINGSGYWSPVYPDVPDHYPGQVSDYYYTPWGSLTVTDGEVLRNLTEIPYVGLTLERDGLVMYTGARTEEVLARSPSQTWSFRELCPLQMKGEILTPTDWEFARRKARRTVIGRVDRNNYLILSVSNDGGLGLTLHEVNNFFQKYFELEWLFNLDGGPSSALLARKKGARSMRLIMGGKAKDIDVLVFTEQGGN